MSSSITIDTSEIQNLVNQIGSEELRKKLDMIPYEKGIMAIVVQAIRENFDEQGPGWAPLKTKTFKNKVLKGVKKKISRLSGAEIQELDELTSKPAGKRTLDDDDRLLQLNIKMKSLKKPITEKMTKGILVRSSVLRKSVTSPGANGNINRVEGHNFVWGSDLKYANVHNYGFAKKNIPQREFLVVKDKWMAQIEEFVNDKVIQIVTDFLERK